jgi:hypothetical protein
MIIVKRQAVLGRPGSDLLSQVLRLSTIGAEEFNGRVRDGIGFRLLAKTTRPAKDSEASASEASVLGPAERPGPRTSIHKLRSISLMRRHAKERMGMNNESNQADRAISTGKLHALPRFHFRPINVVVYHGSRGRTRFEVGFSLRCLQRLSRPYIATQHCGWRHNCSTRGTSIPVLSY